MQIKNPPRPLVLASSSVYRRLLMEKLGLHFTVASPQIDESPLTGEAAESIALRLAIAKAHALDDRYPGHLIIGSDQVALQDDLLLGKPGDIPGAVAQLMLSSKKWVDFHTAVCVHDSTTGISHSASTLTRVKFKALTRTQVEHYVARDRPLDCAGSFKSEGLGIALLEEIRGEDPNALVGLPLIKLTELLARFGVEVI